MKSAINRLTEQLRLLKIEYEEEKLLFSKINDEMGISRLIDRGLLLYPVTPGNSFYNSINQRVIELKISNPDSEQDELPDDYIKNFEPAKHVSFIKINPDKGEKPKHLFDGIISFFDGKRIVIAIDDHADITLLQPDKEFRIGVMCAFDETSYRTMFEALNRVIIAKGRLGELRDIFYSNKNCSFLSFNNIGFPYLNDSQTSGVNKIIKAKDVAILHGPPGTGKTTTLVEAIVETLRREPQVMVCAQSNMAVDWICEKLQQRGINILRLGNPARVNDAMLTSTYERRFADHPEYSDLWSIRKEIRLLYSSKKRGETWKNRMDKLKARATELEYRINQELLADSRVIASTLVGSNHKLLSGIKFPTLFIDEAAQALEAACWIPIAKAGRVIFAGDHCQLPPTVKSFEALRQGLGISLMEVLVENHPEAVTLLETQYRMHERIMGFSNGWFYGGRMKADPSVRHRGILDWDTPMEWIDTADSNLEDVAERDSQHGPGKVNKEEGRLTLRILENYVEEIGIDRVINERIDFGLISPYRAQVAYLRKLVKSSQKLRRIRKQISINTIDGFQGQERDVMVISLVRSNERGEIGFLRDLRRMNVAITRARMKVILVGNSQTLSKHKFYRRLIRYIKEDI